MQVLGQRLNKADAASLAALQSQLTASDPGYLRNEEFVIVEVFYNHPTITGFPSAVLPMYSYTVMPVSAPS